MLEGKEGNRTEEIHDTGNFGGLGINYRYNSLIIAREAYMLVGPKGSQGGTGKVNGEQFLPCNTNIRGRDRLMTELRVELSLS